MKKLKILVFLILLIVTAISYGGATQYNLLSKNTPIPSDWFRTGRFKDFGTNWARDIDALVALGINPGTGSIFYVDSGVSNEGDGSSWLNAKDTLDEGIDLTENDRGDWIAVAQAHAESGSAANLWDADVDGITIWHLGNGSNQGTYTFADTDTTVSVGAANVFIKGGRLLAGISEVVIGLDVTADADYLTVFGMEFPEPITSSFEFNIAVQLVTGADDVTFANCKAYSAHAAGADHWLNGGAGVVNRLTLINNTVHGEFAIAPIFSDQIDLELFIAGNDIQQMTSGQFAVEFTAAATGTFAGNTLYSDAWATILDPGSLKCNNNWGTIAIDEQGIQIPLSASTATITAVADGSNLERLEFVQQQYSVVKAINGFANGTAGLFTIAGGPIQIVDIVSYVTVEIGGEGNLVNYNINPTTPGTDTAFGTDGTALETNGNAIGTLYTWNGVIANDLTDTTNGTALSGGTAANGEHLIVPIGALELATANDGTVSGEITVYMTYRPLAPGVTVTAQ